MTATTTTKHSFAINSGDVKPLLSNGGVIRNVSLIALGEAKGHGVFVDQTTLSQVLRCLTSMGNVKVKLDHGSGVLSTAGYVDNFTMGHGKVLGDLHIYDSEPAKSRILEIAVKNPHHLGMSLEFEGVDQISQGRTFARCSDVDAVALVSSPAANSSLFSTKSVDTATGLSKQGEMSIKKIKTNFSEPGDDKNKNVTTTAMGDESDTGGSNSFDQQKQGSPDPAMDPQAQQFAEIKRMHDSMKAMHDKMYGNADALPTDSINNKDDKSKGVPAAINPNAEPVAGNNGPKMAQQDKGGEVQGEGEKRNPPGAWEDEEKRFDRFGEKLIKKFAASLGIHSVPTRGAGSSDITPGRRNFSTLVEERKKHLMTKGLSEKDAQQQAMMFCIKNHKDEYSQHRTNIIQPAKAARHF